MASKYIQSREDALSINQADAERLAEFINNFGEALGNLLETCSVKIQDISSVSDSDEFNKYQLSLESAGFSQSEITQIEHTLFLKGFIGEKLFIESNYQLDRIIEEYSAINEGVIDALKWLWNALTEDGSPIGILHFLLDVIGFIPASYFGFPIDIVADALNGIIYMFRGRWLDAIISLIAALLPGIGDVAKAAKYGKNAAKLEKAVESIIKTGKAEEKLIAELAQDSSSKLVLDSMSSTGTIMLKTFAGIASGLGHLLSTPPINWLTFGGSAWLGKKFIKWSDETITPIARNLENFGTKSLAGVDDISAIIKSGDVGKMTDNFPVLIKDTPFAKMLADSNVQLTKEMAENPELFMKTLDQNYDKFVDALSNFRSGLKKPLTKEELTILNGEMRAMYYEMKTNQMLATGLLTLDKAGGDVMAKYFMEALPDGAFMYGTPINIFKALKNDPKNIQAFFVQVLSSPTLEKSLAEAGPGVLQLFRVFAKNPEFAIKLPAAGAEAAARFAKLESELGDLGVALYRRRFNRNRLIIAKYLIGAPMRCPVKFLASGSNILMSNASKLLSDEKSGDKKGFGQFNEGLKYIKPRYQFLFESEKDSANAKAEEEFYKSTETSSFGSIETNVDVATQAENLKKEVKAQTKEIATKQITAILGPKSFNDICLSVEASVVDDAAVVKTASETGSGHSESDRRQIQEISGHSDLGATRNDAELNTTLSQVGIPQVNNSSEGIFSAFNDATPMEDITIARIDGDLSERGLWYHLASIQRGELTYEGSTANKVDDLLELYGKLYGKVAKNASRLGKPTMYPTPIEVQTIREELDKIKKDPSYRPNFFGADVSASAIN